MRLLIKRVLPVQFLAPVCAIAVCAIQPLPSAVATLPPNLTIAQSEADPLQQALDRGEIAAAIQLIEVGWKRQYEEYWGGQLTTQLRSAEEISQSLAQLNQQTQTRSALIYAVPTAKHLELIVVMPGAKPLHRRVATVSRDQLVKRVEALRSSVTNREAQPRDYLPPAQQVYQWLIAPIAADLKAQNVTQLIFCLGTGLRTAPLAALHDGEQFLVEQYDLAIIPAFNLLDVQRSNLRQARVLAMGAEKFAAHAPLPAVPLEVAVITNHLWQGTAFLNQNFTLENLKQARAQYPYEIVHLATHANFVPGVVSESYILFGDRPLGLDQVRSIGLANPATQLLVLSACQTALGSPQAELGFAGLAVQSGAKTAIASLWAVDDTGTLVLMSEFYHQLKTARTVSAALRQAKLAVLSGRVKLATSQVARTLGPRSFPPELMPLAYAELSHPYYWAAFTVIGNAW